MNRNRVGWLRAWMLLLALLVGWQAPVGVGAQTTPEPMAGEITTTTTQDSTFPFQWSNGGKGWLERHDGQLKIDLPNGPHGHVVKNASAIGFRSSQQVGEGPELVVETESPHGPLNHEILAVRDLEMWQWTPGHCQVRLGGRSQAVSLNVPTDA